MTLCPVALAIGCKKCPIFGFCPVKGVIGDYTKPAEDEPDEKEAKPRAGQVKKAAKRGRRN